MEAYRGLSWGASFPHSLRVESHESVKFTPEFSGRFIHLGSLSEPPIFTYFEANAHPTGSPGISNPKTCAAAKLELPT